MTERELYQKTTEKTLRGAYLFCGAEELTKQEAVARVKTLLDPAFLDVNLHTLKTPTATELLTACGQMPFFDALHVVQVSDWDDAALFDEFLRRVPDHEKKDKKKEKETPPELQQLLLQDDVVVLFLRRGEAKQTPFFQAFAAVDHVICFEALDEARAQKFCMREAALSNVFLDDRTARTLIGMVGTDAYRLRNELSKSCDYVGAGGTITDAVLKIVVTPNAEYNAFQMLDALLAGNQKRAVRMLEQAQIDNKESPMRVASFLEGRLKNILIAREMLDAKQPQKDIVARIGGSPYAAKNAIKSAQSYTAAQLREWLAAFAAINYQIKSGAYSETDALTMALFHKARNG